MAKFTPSILLSQVSGKIGGAVTTASPNSLQIRPRAKIRRRQTDNQFAVKQLMASFSSQWRTLSEAIRDNWISATGDYTYPDRLGNIILPTGINLFSSINIGRMVTGFGPSTDTPEPQTYPPVDAQGLDLIGAVFFYNITFQGAPETSRVAFFISGPMSPGITAYGPSDIPFLESFVLEEDQTYDITDSWEAKWGSLASHSGKKVFGEAWATTQFVNDTQRLIAQSSFILP